MRSLYSFLLATTLTLCITTPVFAQDLPTLQITWPPEGANIQLGNDDLRSIGVVVHSNYKLMPAGQCGTDARCGHIHMKIDQQGDTCNLPGRPYNSMNSDFGGSLIKANFGACVSPTGEHVIAILLADDQHNPVLIEGKPIIAEVKVITH